MKYTVEKGKKSTVKITIDLTATEWQSAISEAYEKTKGKYSMPGFRKGKVPKKVLETAYGEGVFYEEAINTAFPKYYTEILDKEKSIDAVAAPDLDIKKIGSDGITMIAVVVVKPEVVIGTYKGINFKKNVYNVKDEEIEDEIKRLQERNSRLVDVTDRAVENGDNVIIDYSGSVDGVKFDGGTAEKQTLVIGSGTFIPGFEEQLIGMNIGEERDINVKFPEEYHAENLKGKDAVFAIKLHEIKKKELPEINDEFIKEAIGSESVEAYKKETRERLEKQNADRAEREVEDEIIKKVTETSDVEIPDAMIENQIDRMVQEMEYRLQYQGLKLADYLKYMDKSMEDFRKDYAEQAAEYVKSQLVIEAIIEREEIKATDEEVEKRVEEMATAQGKPVPDVKKNINARQLDYIKNDIIIKKFFDFLKTSNTIE
ncbi:MAG: trigger factor [Clostridiales bacterium]|nr:trigger factor [Clostridiales bacterium]